MVLLPSRAPELNSVENIWQYLRQNRLSDSVFDTYAVERDEAEEITPAPYDCARQSLERNCAGGPSPSCPS